MDLREARFKRRISQWKLAIHAGVHQSRISLIENGYPPRDYEKSRLVEGLRIAPEEIEWPEVQERKFG